MPEQFRTPKSMIEDKIKIRLVTEFEQELFLAALANLADRNNKLRFNNFAYAIRELTRHFLKRLAPDDEVKKCPWYKNETGDPDKISRRERIIYSVQGGLENNYIINSLGIDIASLNTKFSALIKKLNKHTHVNPGTFGIDDKKVDELTTETLEILDELFELIESSRELIVQPLQDQIDNVVFEKAVFETHPEIDLCATHHFIECVEVYEHEIHKIDSEKIYITAHGNLETVLQYGSSGDLRRGDGATIPHSFPFTSEFISQTSNPEELLPVEPELIVDESSWYGE